MRVSIRAVWLSAAILFSCPLGAAQRTWIVDARNRPGTNFRDLPEAVAAARAGLALAQTVSLPLLPIPQPSGVGSVSFTVPNAPALVGAPLYAQALVVPFPLPARLTNVTADVIIR